MLNRISILFLLILCTTVGVHAQIKAKAISYTLEVDLTKFSPQASELSQKTCNFEVDAYYTDTKLKTVVRIISRPTGFDLTIMERLYDLNQKDEYNINHDNKNIILKKDQDFKLKSTGKQKTILGNACKEYIFTDYRKINFSVWVAEKLTKNVCPVGNFSLKGTALEITTSNGLHYLAVDTAEGDLAPGFFDLPTGYQQEVVTPPAK
jgi:hypothetical protein